MNKQTISRYELIPTLIKASSFEVVFIKKNGQERTMKCLFESTRYIEQGILTVFDLVKQKYRSINFKTLKQIIIADMIYQPTPKGKLLLIGNRKEKLLEKIYEIIDRDIAVLRNWSYDELLFLYDELEQITISYDLEALRALFEYAYESGSVDFNMEMIMNVLQGDLEFIPKVTIEQVAQGQMFSICIETPEYINIEYIDYQYTTQDIEAYYYEASNGVLQVKKI